MSGFTGSLSVEGSGLTYTADDMDAFNAMKSKLQSQGATITLEDTELFKLTFDVQIDVNLAAASG